MTITKLPLEILTVIFELLDPLQVYYCAFVCKHWKDPAVYTGWKNYVEWKDRDLDFAWLLRAWTQVDQRRENSQMKGFIPYGSLPFTETLASPRWMLLKRLRHKVTGLKIQTSLKTSDVRNIMKLFHATDTPTNPFCPNVRFLEFPGSYYPEYNFLVGRSLRKLEIKYLQQHPYQYDGIEGGTLGALASRCPEVDEITIGHSNFAVNLGVFSKLRALDYTGTLSVTFWTQLCEGCPLVEKLWISTDNEIRVTPEQLERVRELGKKLRASPEPPTHLLPALRALDLGTQPRESEWFLKEEKVELENLLEAENEAHVNRLTRELSALRIAQAQQQASSQTTDNNDGPSSSVAAGKRPATNGSAAAPIGITPSLPSQNLMLEAMRRENQELRNRLVEYERGYIRVTRMNDIYREELIELRRRLGMPIDNLIGLPAPSSTDIYSQPTHVRPQPTVARTSSPELRSGSHAGDAEFRPGGPSRVGLPIPIARGVGATPRPAQHASSSYPHSATPNTNSPSSLTSTFPFSPTTSPHVPVPGNHHHHHRPGGGGGTATSNSSSTGSVAASADDNLISPGMVVPSSYLTQGTTPPSSTSPLVNVIHHGGETHLQLIHQLSYPSVPPPSLSSSLGSPVYSRRNSFGQNPGTSLGSAGRRTSIERGARIAETGSLVRNRRASVASGGMPLTSETVIESPPGSSPSSVVGIGD
ncbi:hypothetical protein FRB90_012757 [Tulasnella sp. 427]|nr:hypothetical protein FRB90_012757 [Tulasnella sp. 427]